MSSKKFFRGHLFQETISDLRYANSAPSFCLLHRDLFSKFLGEGIVNLYMPNFVTFCLQVTVIIEIMIRKCGFSAVESVSPEKYRRFLKSVLEVT